MGTVVPVWVLPVGAGCATFLIVLLDQKRTRRMVVIVSIICAAGFVGVLPIVLGLVVFGGGGSGSQTQQVLKDAENRVKATPDSIDALVSLAALYRGANRTQDEAVTLQKAMGVGVKNNDELQLLLGGLAQQVGQRLQVLQDLHQGAPQGRGCVSDLRADG